MANKVMSAWEWLGWIRGRVEVRLAAWNAMQRGCCPLLSLSWRCWAKSAMGCCDRGGETTHLLSILLTWLCSAHFISGQKSNNPVSPNYEPSVFAHTKSLVKKKLVENIHRFKRCWRLSEGEQRTKNEWHLLKFLVRSRHSLRMLYPS